MTGDTRIIGKKGYKLEVFLFSAIGCTIDYPSGYLCTQIHIRWGEKTPQGQRSSAHAQ